MTDNDSTNRRRRMSVKTYPVLTNTPRVHVPRGGLYLYADTEFRYGRYSNPALPLA